jgi:hypothetical protein
MATIPRCHCAAPLDCCGRPRDRSAPLPYDVSSIVAPCRLGGKRAMVPAPPAMSCGDDCRGCSMPSILAERAHDAACAVRSTKVRGEPVMAPSPTIPRYRAPRRGPVDPLPPRRRSGVPCRSPVARRSHDRTWSTPVDRRTGRSLLLATVAATPRQTVDAGYADRRRDVELVGIGLGVWVLFMLAVVQWA